MNKKNEKNFESALKRLEQISDLLENEETPLEESIKLFNLENIGKSPSKLDIERIKSINIEYIKSFNDDDLFRQFQEYLNKFYSDIKIAPEIILKIKKSIYFLKT